MAYDKSMYLAVKQRMDERRLRAQMEAAERKEELYAALPQLEQLDRKLAATGAAVAKAVLAGGDVEQAVLAIGRENQAMQEEKRRLLAKAGLTPQDLEPRYRCPKCGDTGLVEGRRCECLQGELQQEASRRLNAISPLALSRFDTFDLRYYPNVVDEALKINLRDKMGEILAYCRRYSEIFSLRSPSVFMIGNTGLGKTHLSLAIAGEVLKKGYNVIYRTTQALIGQAERERFSREGEGDSQETMLACDLLILDDLGCEFPTQFTVSVLYNLINTRLNTGRPTIISTNYTRTQLKEKYTDRVCSRIFGCYDCLTFVGADIRQQKKLY